MAFQEDNVVIDDEITSDIIFNVIYRRQEKETIAGDHTVVAKMSVGIGEYRSLVNEKDIRYLLLGTERGNVVISRVNDRRDGATSKYCYRVNFEKKGLGSLTRIKQNESVTKNELAKLLGYYCNDVQTRLVNKRTDGTHRFTW